MYLLIFDCVIFVWSENPQNTQIEPVRVDTVAINLSKCASTGYSDCGTDPDDLPTYI